MNIFGGIIVLILSVILGVLLSSKYTKRKDFFLQFSLFNNRLQKEVSFSSASIGNITKNLSKEKDFNQLTADYFSGEKNLKILSYLSKEENEYFSFYLQNIGLSDRETQLSFISKVEQELNEKVKVSEEEEKKYKSLYVKLGFLFGLIMLIIML